MLDLAAVFDKYDNEFRKTEFAELKHSKRADLNAFIDLDILVPEPNENGFFIDIVAAAEHDEIWLSTDCDLLAERATDGDIVNLIRCGVMYDRDLNALHMFR